MKKLRIIVMLVAFIFTLGSFIEVNAATVTVGNSTNNRFTITRTINKVTNKVSNTFTYSITALGTNPATVSSMPTEASVVFDNVQADSTSKVATSTGAIDLSSVVFNEVGDYKFVVQETGSSDINNYPVDSTDKYTIQVSVRYEVINGTPTSNKVITISAISGEGASAVKLAEPNFEFTSDAVLSSINISNVVEGNMADVDKYFKVLVTINGGENGDTYKISGQTYDGASTTYTVGQTNYIYLKHGETITIGKDGNDGQIPTGFTYSFVEQDATDYTTNINSSTVDSKESGNRTVETTNNNTIKNIYEESTLTGVFLKVVPYVIVIVIAIAGILYLVIRTNAEKKKA